GSPVDTGIWQMPSCVAKGSRFTTVITMLSPVRFRYAKSCSFSVSRNVMLSRCCSAGFCLRARFSARTSGSSGPSSARRFVSYFSESRYSSLASLQVLVENVRRVRDRVRPVRLAPVEELADELEQLPAGVLPGEVRVALREADLAERRHHRRPRERLGEEDHLRVLPPHLVDQPLPERHGLRVRVVDAEDGDPARDPEEHDVAKGRPEGLPLRRVEVDVV